MSKRLGGIIGCKYKTSLVMNHLNKKAMYNGLGGANPAVNTPRPSRGTRIESCDFIVLIGDP